MEVRPSFPAGTVAEFIAYAKSNPGKITMATSGSGSPPHVWGEMFKMMAGVDLIPVPYRGGSGPALADLMGGQVDVTFDPLASSIELIKAGKIKPLAVTSAQRSKMLPHVPAMGEFVAGYDAGAWIGLGAPRGTPPEIVRRLNGEINAALADPTIRARFEEFGTSVLVSSPSEFAEIIVRDIEKWAGVVRAAKIKVD
jgi:tripartite-type tricarboxylate transporter receptor subunit TctC